MIPRNFTLLYVAWAIMMLIHPDVATPFIGLYLGRVFWRQF